jgi:hypothetical protein
MQADMWEACDDPRKLLEWVRRLGTDRQFRLFACAFWRWARFQGGELPDTVARALEFAESWAETGVRPDGYPVGFPGWHPLLARTGFDAANWSIRGSPACGRGWIGPAEQTHQVALVRELFGNPFRQVAFDSASLTTTIVSLAQAAYQERHLPSGHLDSAHLAVLADALEDVGCPDAAILDHLRGPGPHVRGCWPVDLILAKG